MGTSLGLYLVNRVLPDSHKLSGPITNKGLHDHLAGLAKSDPAKYVRTVTALKHRGDEIATLEGISVGLDDIEPQYEARDAILKPAIEAMESAKTPEVKQKIVIDAQTKLLAYTKAHPGTMTHMATSGARGNPSQLMKIIGSPLALTHPKRGLEPELVDRSYAEGLTPAQYWRAGPEVRANEVAARISVSEPGEMAKVLVANVISTVVTAADCGTLNGIRASLDDPHAVDRHAQADHGVPRNTLVTPQLVQQLKHRGVHDLLVRSPMTCSAPRGGVCQMCQGLSERGRLQPVGTPVGVRAAQAMAEPLTQMALSSRHSSLSVKEQGKGLTGLKGVRQLLEVPKTFKYEALLAPKAGVVEHVEAAPQGGHYVSVAGTKRYVRPDLSLRVKPGDHVEEGDVLTDGVPNPAEVVAAKGLGAGRAHFVDALHKLYKNEGVDLDRRHLEVLAKSEINHVRLLDVDPAHPEFLKGDVLNYNRYRDAYAASAEARPVHEAVGQRLGREVLHHTVGTVVTPSLVKSLTSAGVAEVHVSPNMPRTEFVMRSFAMNPLHHEDWMGRLAHRFLKNTVREAAAYGESSDIHGTHPVPAYAFGAEMGHGDGGTF